MHFDLEIFFGGLCFFQLVANEGRHPTGCKVVLVNATKEFPCDENCYLGPRTPRKHLPRMVVPAKYVIMGKDDLPQSVSEDEDGCDNAANQLHAGPMMTVSETGEDLLSVDLIGATVQLKPTRAAKSFPLYVPMHRRRGEFDRPDREAARHDWFDWVALLHDVDPDFVVKHDLSIDDEEEVASIVSFRNGELETSEVGQQRGENLMFDFLTVCGEKPNLCDKDSGGPSPDSDHHKKHRDRHRYGRCLAERVVLRFRRLEYPLKVTIEWPRSRLRNGKHKKFVFGIGPARPELRPVPPVRASITNLDHSYNRANRAIYDFLWFYELGCWPDCPDGTKPLCDRVVPWPRASKYAGRTPSNGNCPPAGG